MGMPSSLKRQEGKNLSLINISSSQLCSSLNSCQSCSYTGSSLQVEAKWQRGGAFKPPDSNKPRNIFEAWPIPVAVGREEFQRSSTSVNHTWAPRIALSIRTSVVPEAVKPSKANRIAQDTALFHWPTLTTEPCPFKYAAYTPLRPCISWCLSRVSIQISQIPGIFPNSNHIRTTDVTARERFDECWPICKKVKKKVTTLF